jgi:hypothetical protein
VGAVFAPRIVFPQALQRAVPHYRRVVREELESPLLADTTNFQKSKHRKRAV